MSDLQARLDAAEKRLEVWATLESGERVRAAYDGIACRDETIRLLESQLEKCGAQISEAATEVFLLLLTVETLKTKLLDQAEDWAMT